MCHLDHHRKIPTQVIGCAIRGETEEIEKRTKFERDTLNQEKHGEVTDPTGTGDPYWWIREKSTKLISEYQDCHTVVKEAEHLRVQELVKRIENHPHREAHHADLQQNNVYNPFSDDS